MASEKLYTPQRNNRKKENFMTINDDENIIPTSSLKKKDIGLGEISWKKFSNFALTFDPLEEKLTNEELSAIGEKIPKQEHNIKVLRAYLYNWQRIWNNKSYEPPQDFLQQAQEVMSWIHEKLPE